MSQGKFVIGYSPYPFEGYTQFATDDQEQFFEKLAELVAEYPIITVEIRNFD